MSDTPDFDSMSPEEMMKWMESLAVRQGASEGLTTSADMAIDEVDENDERLEGMGEYKPYGMSDDDWAKMQEREEAEKAEKAARLASQPQESAPPSPEREPIPEPVAQEQPVAADDGTPDFDSMSPEEMMEWMESLAKRQGADEGFTTTASMQVAEVDENDERLEGMGEYKPYGMSDDDWAKMQEREKAEKAEKAARLASQQQDSAPPPPAPEPEPIAEPVAEAQPSATDDGTPDFDSMSPEEMMEWMESLAKRQGADEGFTTTASMQVAEVDENDERLEGMGEYKPYGMSDDDWAKMQEREEAEKAARLASQQTDAIAEEEYTYEDDEDYVEYEDDEEYFESSEDSEDLVAAMFDLDDTQDDNVLPNFEDILPADDPVAETENPMDWLNSLSGGDEAAEAPDLDFSLEGLGDLAGLGETEATGDPMDWLNSLSGGDDNAIDLSALTDDNDEGSLEWMESLASDEGADSEELITAAGLDIPRPDAVQDDGPGYEEFSFEEATGMVNDTETALPVTQSEMDLENPEGWLDSLASDVASNDLPDDFFDGSGNEIPIPDDFFDGAENELPDDLFDGIELEADAEEDEEEFDSLKDNVKAQMDSGKLGDSPEDINAFFASAFAKAAERTDVPDYIDMEDDEEVDIDDVEMPVQAEIPDWLQESMSTAPQAEVEDEEPIKKTATAEMMIADLGLEDEVEESEIPNWLQTGSEEDTGVIDTDIFAPEIVEEAGEQLTVLDATDTQDTWVDAFSKEDSREMKQWYESAVANLDGDELTVAQTFEAETEPLAVIEDFAGLAVADLPIESKLAEGSPQNVPDWMSDKSSQSVEVEAVQNDMSWLDETVDDVVAEADDADMPDWLQETVDDSVTGGEDLPDWLAGESDISQDEIPDWLRETMDEEEVSVADIEPLLEEVATQAPVAPAPAPLPVPVAQSPAPIQAVDEKIDAVAYLRSAKEKIAGRNIEGAMLDYEQVIRANKALPQVEKELQRLTDDKSYKKNPSINRVLGDVLMRQGKLQEALDTYRKALNML